MGFEHSKEQLFNYINLYLDALVVRNPAGLPVSPRLKATENGKPLLLGAGLWETARCVEYRKSFVDPAANQAGFFGVVVEKGDGRAIFVLRLKIKYGQIEEVETLVAREGCHALFSPQSMTLKPIWDTAIPESERLPRERLIEAADLYFEGLEQHNAAIIPFHPDCNRRENGIQTTNNPPRFPRSAAGGIANLKYIEKVRDRRFPIIDGTRGLVLGIVCFDVPGVAQTSDGSAESEMTAALAIQPRTLFLYELFKIEDGLIRDIEAFMSNAPLGASLGW
jgi:hypothetical protein